MFTASSSLDKVCVRMQVDMQGGASMCQNGGLREIFKHTSPGYCSHIAGIAAVIRAPNVSK